MSAGLAMGQSGATVRHLQTPQAKIAQAVWVGDTLYVGGQVASPVTPEDKGKGTAATYGNTETQAKSTLTNIQAILKAQGLDMKDVVAMHVLLTGDPANGGKMDFAGLQAAYTQFFGTAEQPNEPARTTMQVSALVEPWEMVEIEVIAVKSK